MTKIIENIMNNSFRSFTESTLVNLTLYKIDAMMDGDLDDLCNALASEHQAELLAALGDN